MTRDDNNRILETENQRMYANLLNTINKTENYRKNFKLSVFHKP